MITLNQSSNSSTLLSEKNEIKQKAFRITQSSLLTDATIYDYKKDRTLVNFHDTRMIKSFMGTNNISAINQVLMTAQYVTDTNINSNDLEQFRLGHYIPNLFINTVKDILFDYGYTKCPNDIILMLLVYKYYYEWAILGVPEFKNTAVHLIEKLEKLNITKSSGAVTSFRNNREAHEREFILLLYQHFIKDEKNVAFIKNYKQSHNEIKNVFLNAKALMKGDKEKELERLRRLVIKLFFIELKNSNNNKKSRHECIGRLLALVDGHYILFNKNHYDEVIQSYNNKFRHITIGLP